jgi:hypothetical protein
MFSNMDEAMNLYSPDGASTRGSACRNCPLLDEARTKMDYRQFYLNGDPRYEAWLEETQGIKRDKPPTEQEYIEFFHQRLDEARTYETKT